MPSELSKNKDTLFNKIDIILWEDWDPIGVNGIEKARSEYYQYIPNIITMLKNKKFSIQIAFYLYKVSTSFMGLNEGIRVILRDYKIAKKLKSETSKLLSLD